MSEEAKETKSEITGWIAWHPYHGALLSSYCHSRELVEYLHVSPEDYDDGWCIRPAKLVFLDE